MAFPPPPALARRCGSIAETRVKPGATAPGATAVGRSHTPPAEISTANANYPDLLLIRGSLPKATNFFHFIRDIDVANTLATGKIFALCTNMTRARAHRSASWTIPGAIANPHFPLNYHYNYIF
jgi:hypothetical protein